MWSRAELNAFEFSGKGENGYAIQIIMHIVLLFECCFLHSPTKKVEILVLI